jgi:hypothetical protein
VKVFLDLDVLLDIFQKREPHWQASAQLVSHCQTSQCRPLFAAHSVTTLFYIVNKYSGRSAALETVRWVLSTCTVVAVDAGTLAQAADSAMSDFEIPSGRFACRSIFCRPWTSGRSATEKPGTRCLLTLPWITLPGTGSAITFGV